ncbi:MAG: GNAT family N-acetyltransferase [Acidobacteria bacterium]|jgi:RimJ/RimL family protein N-acetyltransferase|nr:GNAT family N-acetyltransferase [Acidobacteriota bacterium]
MSLHKSFIIRPLEPADAAAVSAFMRSQSSEYLRFFYAFGSDESEIAEVLSKCRMDIYSGVFWEAELVSVFMLRGWDAGYEIPSYGILTDEKYRGNALMSLTVETAKCICRLSEVKRLMAKYHPDNTAMSKLYRHGFRQTGVEESTGNIILHLEI